MSAKKETSRRSKIQKGQDLESSSAGLPEPQDNSHHETGMYASPSSIVGSDQQDRLDVDDVSVLKEIVREYKAHRIDFTVLPARPRFKPPRINTGIICNAEIRRRASAKAKADPHATGGSLSSLTELLLWKYLGCPSDVVERFPREP